ncbi:hypothetical protein, partial [Campylobacter sp.]|uniref:hypothetical protein n=1 Tax=Campylobacter sp. TaxID=205 RepID=UPI00362452D6
ASLAYLNKFNVNFGVEIYSCAYISFYIDCVKIYPEAAPKTRFIQRSLSDLKRSCSFKRSCCFKFRHCIA